MREIATADNLITILYHGESVRAKKTRALLLAEDIPVREWDISRVPLTGTQIVEIADLLGISLQELVNKDHPEYISRFGDAEIIDEESLIAFIRKNPTVIRQPIVIYGKKALIVDSPNDVLKILKKFINKFKKCLNCFFTI